MQKKIHHIGLQIVLILVLGSIVVCQNSGWAANRLPASIVHPDSVCSLHFRLLSQGYTPDPIIDEVCASFLETNPLDLTNQKGLQLRVDTGVDFWLASKTADSSCTFILEVLSDRLLGPVAYTIEKGVEEGQISRKDPGVQTKLAQLNSCNIYPNLPLKTWEKIVLNVKAGNWEYLWSRFRTRYLKATLLALSFFLSLAFNFFTLGKAIQRRRKKRLSI